jgi:hypothetical protein
VANQFSILKYLSLKSQHQILQLFKIRRPQPGDRIPTHCSIPVRAWDNAATRNRGAALWVNSRTTYRASSCDIIEGPEADQIEERVQEAEGGLASAEASVVEQGDGAGECGACC